MRLKKTRGLSRSRWFVIFGIALFLVSSRGLAEKIDPKEHFLAGEMRGSLSWDSMSAIVDNVLKFGASFGVYITHGMEVGMEQQFIVPETEGGQSRTWGYVRFVPFRKWVASPFVSARLGYYLLTDRQAMGVGGGAGFVIFIDTHFAFEASIYSQIVLSPNKAADNQLDAEWRVVIFF